MSQASQFEQQMLSLINAERTSRGLDPVQLELRLNDSAEDHSEWMLNNNVFSHTGVGGSSAGDRMADAGFSFPAAGPGPKTSPGRANAAPPASPMMSSTCTTR